MYKKISYSKLLKKLESHNQWLGGLGGKLGKTVEVKDFDLDYSKECSTGIHFFRTMRELQEYRFYLP